MDERAIRLQEDISALKSLTKECLYLQVLSSCEDSLQLKLFNPLDENGSLELIFNFSTADYPEGTVVSVDAAIRTEAKPLLELVALECYNWCRENDLELPQFVEMKKDILNLAISPDLQQTLDTQASVVSTDYAETSDTDGDAYDGFDDEDEEDSFVHPVLDMEIMQVRQKFGHNSIENRIHAGIDEMDLFFKIDLNDFLDGYTGKAWGVNLELPLIILLHIRSVSKYLDGVEPKLDVFQDSPKQSGEKIKVGMGVQLKKIMEGFVSSQWKALTNSKVEEALLALGGGESLQAGLGAFISPSEDMECFPAGHEVVRQSSLGAQMSKFSDSTPSQADKAVPSLKNGFLVQFLQYALNRIQSLNEFCVICDERHIVETGLLKPCVCTRELCVFAFQTLGVMADAAEAIATDADVVDLLIAMGNAASNSSRCTLILDPYPSVVDPDNSAVLALDPKNKDFDFVRRVFEDVVKCREQVVKGRAASFEQSLDGRHKLALPLMQWIVATCRAHIVLLPQERLLKSMKTKYQFLLISSPPKKEAAFKTAKEKFGSTFAFHGSNIENWHSILRKGLINASGTKYQLHGAAYGNGIYLSPNSNVSFGYTSSYHSKKPANKEGPPQQECLAGKLTLKCLALCEVVTKDLRKSSTDIWVSLNPDYVCTRFFFVYDDPCMSGLRKEAESISTINPEFRQEIDHAMEYIAAVKAIT